MLGSLRGRQDRAFFGSMLPLALHLHLDFRTTRIKIIHGAIHFVSVVGLLTGG